MQGKVSHCKDGGVEAVRALIPLFLYLLEFSLQLLRQRLIVDQKHKGIHLVPKDFLSYCSAPSNYVFVLVGLDKVTQLACHFLSVLTLHLPGFNSSSVFVHNGQASAELIMIAAVKVQP